MYLIIFFLIVIEIVIGIIGIVIAIIRDIIKMVIKIIAIVIAIVIAVVIAANLTFRGGYSRYVNPFKLTLPVVVVIGANLAFRGGYSRYESEDDESNVSPPFSDTVTPINDLEYLQRALRDHQRQEHELEIRINALLKENGALQSSYQEANKEARQLNTILRDLSDLVTKTDEPADGHKISQAMHSVTMEDAYNANELLLSVQEDWSGRGSHAEFKRGETIPLEKGRVLGYGVNGEVVEATCRGVKVAWKKILHRPRIPIGQMKEIDVLKKLKHRHIVKLVGTYTQQPYLGLLLWPVARCDLALVLELMELDGLYNQSSAQEPGFLEKLTEHDLNIEELRDIVGAQDKRIWSSFGCLTRAIAYLHENNIRHKDIKPSNILLSRDGIWITDFGSARDFTADLTSTSESRERGTLRYCAPEHLLDEIRQMLSHDRTRRPTARALASRISIIDESNDNEQTKQLHGSCCDLRRELKVYKERIEKLEAGQHESQNLRFKINELLGKRL
ncbi:kinase-like protein [Zopfia rhizophila CBS 207.26]|uniref:Kinase-like protein n=1 Tax=Zopfia rhizophila CBS 207.26 TaxID=1314779 RepID=A0A6A6E7I6_9PEZI|nr:kinase-like protein [Zopfia rhizophila CBS 207.26]